MDQMRLKQYFEHAFDVLMTNATVTKTSWSEPLVGINSSVSSIEQPFHYDISITCCFITIPPSDYSHLMWFDMRDCGHVLHFIRTTHDQHANMLELRYRTIDCEKFVEDVRDAKYRRFSRQFHKQLEDILD